MLVREIVEDILDADVSMWGNVHIEGFLFRHRLRDVHEEAIQQQQPVQLMRCRVQLMRCSEPASYSVGRQHRRARIAQVTHGIQRRAPLHKADVIRVVFVPHDKTYATLVLKLLDGVRHVLEPKWYPRVNACWLK